MANGTSAVCINIRACDIHEYIYTSYLLCVYVSLLSHETCREPCLFAVVSVRESDRARPPGAKAPQHSTGGASCPNWVVSALT